MGKDKYVSLTVGIANRIIGELITSKCLDPCQSEPLKDAILTAIDWHCAPLFKR